jgi:superfamily II DNA or RNA helicase
MAAVIDDEANQFVSWCNDQDHPEQTLRRTCLNALLGEGDDHVAGTDEAKWALYANSLRMKHHVCALTGDIIDCVVEQLTGDWWIWDPYEGNCFCNECMKETPKCLARFMYTEKLVRREPWYADNDESFLLQTAAKCWSCFFGPLQKYCLPPSPDGDFMAFKAFMSKQGVNLDQPPPTLSDICEDFGAVNHSMRIVYSIAALLNEKRRQQITPCELSDVTPPFNQSIRANFQGFQEDYFCLGSQGYLPDPSTGVGGCKFYVGITNDKARRHGEHCHLENHYPGSKWIKRLCFYDSEPRKPPPDPFGGWKIDKPFEERAHAFHVIQGIFSGADEDSRTETFVANYGALHVRGGIYCTTEPRHSQIDMYFLKKKKRAILNLCYRCGSSQHKSTQCPNPDQDYQSFNHLDDILGYGRRRCLFQPPEDDDAVSLFKHQNWTDADNRHHDFDHFQMCLELGNALVGQQHVMQPSKCILWSSGGDPFEDIENEEVKQLINTVFPHFNGRLRKKQEDAIASFLQSPPKDVVLAVPTAYGKTAVYISAAIKHVLGGGKVVIHLPYSALMSDIATTFAGLSASMHGVATQKSHTIKAKLDVRVEGLSMVYGGTFYVPTSQGGFREITWTIWRGTTNDPYMQQHQQSPIFKNADIVLATPDKWAYPDSKNSDCDSFVHTFKAFLNRDMLIVIDEAHQFSGLLGGTERELLRRMEKILQCKSGSNLRILLASATLGKNEGEATEFATSLMTDRGHEPCIFQPHTPQTFLLANFDDEDDDSDGENDINDLIENARGNGERLHRFIFLYKKKLHLDYVCQNIMKDLLQHHGNLRRVIIFVDSKTQATLYVKGLNVLKARNAHPRLFVSPYHGDCASKHRRIYEKLMNKFVAENELHVIVSTSALEAGVNVRGADMIIIPDGSSCSRASLIQRIGRGGRQARHPAIVLIGTTQDVENAELFADPESYFSGEPEDVDDHPRENLSVDPLGIADTKAIVVNGCCQFLRDAKVLGLPWDSVKDAAIGLVGGARDRDRGGADARHLRTKPDLNSAISYMKSSYEDEVPTKSRLTARGSQSTSIKTLHCNEDGRLLRPGRREDDEDQMPHPSQVELSRVDSIAALRVLHPEAHYRTPHGQLVRILRGTYSPIIKRDDKMDTWLQTLKSVKCTTMTRDVDYSSYPTLGYYKESVESCADSLRLLPHNGNVRFGVLKYTVQWTGFRYVNPRTLKPLDGELPVTIADLTKPRYEGGYGYPHDFPFFQPAKVDVSGWEWSVDISHIDLEDPWDKLARVVGSELRVRSAIKLNSSPQQVRIRLNVDNDRTTLVLQCFETASSGLARELLRSHMVSIFSSPDRYK